MNDLRTIDAVCMNLIRIGEGARNLSAAAKAAMRTVPWPRVTSLRHRLAHSYAATDMDVLWDSATVSVPALVQVMEAYLASDGSD